MAQDNYNRLRAFTNTASFWHGELAGIRQFSLSELDLSHISPLSPPLQLPHIPENTVLGKRVEHFYQFCIEQSLNYDLVAANIQVNVPNRTIGELDYLIKDIKTSKIYHVELVYKFYCYDPNSSEKSAHLTSTQNEELSKYVGPNKRDNFVYKFDRLVNHQLPLLYHPATRDMLEPYRLDIDAIEQRVCFLAHIFIPQELWQHDFKYINKRCISGYYLNEYAFAKACTQNRYYFPEKYAWKMKAHELELSYNHGDALLIAKASIKRGFAPLVWMQLPDGNFERFFIIA